MGRVRCRTSAESMFREWVGAGQGPAASHQGSWGWTGFRASSSLAARPRASAAKAWLHSAEKRGQRAGFWAPLRYQLPLWELWVEPRQVRLGFCFLKGTGSGPSVTVSVLLRTGGCAFERD